MTLILGIIAIICFAAASVGVRSSVNLTALGLVFLTLMFILPGRVF